MQTVHNRSEKFQFVKDRERRERQLGRRTLAGRADCGKERSAAVLRRNSDQPKLGAYGCTLHGHLQHRHAGVLHHWVSFR